MKDTTLQMLIKEREDAKQDRWEKAFAPLENIIDRLEIISAKLAKMMDNVGTE